MARERGVPPPKIISDKPTLHNGLDHYFNTWMKLERGREPGTATPWGAINEFAKRYDILGEDFERLEFFIRALDTAYMRYMKGQADGEGRKGAKNHV